MFGQFCEKNILYGLSLKKCTPKICMYLSATGGLYIISLQKCMIVYIYCMKIMLVSCNHLYSNYDDDGGNDKMMKMMMITMMIAIW